MKLIVGSKFQRSKTKFRTLNPEWDLDSSVFEIPLVPGEPGIDASKLKIELFDHDTIGSHDSLGELRLDGESSPLEIVLEQLVARAPARSQVTKDGPPQRRRGATTTR